MSITANLILDTFEYPLNSALLVHIILRWDLLFKLLFLTSRKFFVGSTSFFVEKSMAYAQSFFPFYQFYLINTIVTVVVEPSVDANCLCHLALLEYR